MTGAWPRVMKRKTAAAYCDLSEAAFVREVLAGALPASIMLGKQEHWNRLAIDAALDALAGDSNVPAHIRRFKERHSEAA